MRRQSSRVPPRRRERATARGVARHERRALLTSGLSARAASPASTSILFASGPPVVIQRIRSPGVKRGLPSAAAKTRGSSSARTPERTSASASRATLAFSPVESRGSLSRSRWFATRRTGGGVRRSRPMSSRSRHGRSSRHRRASCRGVAGWRAMAFRTARTARKARTERTSSMTGVVR